MANPGKENSNAEPKSLALLVFLVLLAFALSIRLVYVFFSDNERFPIQKIKIEASYVHVNHQELVKIISPFLSQSYFSLSVKELERNLLDCEWIDSANINKIWPNTIKVNIVEKKAFAFYNGQLITLLGKQIPRQAELVDEQLPRLVGSKHHQVKVLQSYQNLSKILKAAGLSISKLEFSKKNAWTLRLENGTEVHLGHADIEKRLTRFCEAYPALIAENNTIPVSVDLRYPQAMAVRWI